MRTLGRELTAKARDTAVLSRHTLKDIANAAVAELHSNL